MAVGRIKGRCSFELSRHGAGGWRRGWTGNGARGANDRVVGGGLEWSRQTGGRWVAMLVGGGDNEQI